MLATGPQSLLRWLLRLPVHLYRWRCGWLLGHRFLLLTHAGRRTGLARQTVLEVLRYDRRAREAVVMSGFGREADWFRNVQAHRQAEVVIGRQRFRANHRLLDEDEAVEVLRDYEQRNRLAAPVVRVVLGRLLGSPYDGTESERRRVVLQLPFVAFSPDR